MTRDNGASVREASTEISATPENIRALQLGMHWLPEHGGNGLDRVYYELCQHLPRVGVGVEGLVVGSERVAATSSGRIRAFARATSPIPKRLHLLRKAQDWEMFLSEFNLVASHFALYAYPLLQYLRKRPLVLHFHGPWAAESRVEGDSAFKVWMKTLVEKAVYRNGDRIIVLSTAFRKILEQSYGIPEDRIHVVPGGVDGVRFDTGLSRSEARELLGWPRERPIIFCVRRLAPRMGLEDLVSAMQLISKVVPEALLLVAGKGPLRGELDKRVESMGLVRHVRLLGFVPEKDLAVAYRASDLSVVPTAALEGFGLVAAESLAAGTPVIVRPVGGLPEVVQDLSERLVLPDTSTETLASCLADALCGRTPLPSTSECQDYARARFDWIEVARQTRAVYEQVVQ